MRGAASSAAPVRACAEPQRTGYAHCDVLYHTEVMAGVPSGWGAIDLESAYALPSMKKGAGQTVAVIDAYDQPNIATDLQKYESSFGLPASAFTKLNESGEQGDYPKTSRGWGLEESLDVEMIGAGCPLCNIVLVEANTPKFSDLEVAEASAVKFGATVVSNSYSGHGADVSAYDISGVTILASAGDDGYGISDPADFASVVAVGGTVLSKGGSGRGWSETAWGGSGAGCAGAKDAKPPWQKPSETPGCQNRVANDVSAVAESVAVYDTFGPHGWTVVDGTSISSPLNASIFGLAGNATKQNGGQTFWQKSHRAFLNDVTTGSDGSCSPAYLCQAGPGYDGPTGWGTPNGIGAY